MTMISRIAMAAVTAALMVASAGVALPGQQPRYEDAGFPMTPLQFTVLGSARVQEDSSVPAVTLDGMPASPHQITVLAAPKLSQVQGAHGLKANTGSPSLFR
jgi:hypothetical protein